MMLRVLVCLAALVVGATLGARLQMTIGLWGAIGLVTAAAFVSHLLILNAVFARRGPATDLTRATEAQFCTMMGLAVAVAAASLYCLLYLYSTTRFPGFLLRPGGPDMVAWQARPPHPAYFLPAILLVVLPLLVTLADFLFAANAGWRRIRARIEDRGGLYLRSAATVLILGIAMAGLLMGYPQYLGGLVIVLAGLLLLVLIDRGFSRSRVIGVARHMIAEGLRMKIALVFIGVLVLVVPVMPFTLAGDGVTLTSKVQSFLTYSLTLTGALLSLLTVFLSCATIAGEVRAKQIWMVASKPIPRWQFFAGKWLGIVVLNAALLFLTGLTVWGFSAYLAQLPTRVPDDRDRLHAEVLTARYGVKAEKPDFSAQVEDRIRKLREEGRLGSVGMQAEAELRRQIEDDLRKEWWSLGPDDAREYNFKDLRVNREEGEWLHLRLKPETPTGVDDLEIPILWQAGNRDEVSTITPPREHMLICGRFATIPIPAWAVDSRGNLTLRVGNLDERNSVAFEGDDSFTLLYDLGTFHWNLFRALGVVWCRLAFLAVLGLLTSTFLSFPVACMGCFLVLLVASASRFLTEAIGAAERMPNGEDPLWIFGPVLRPLGRVFVWLVPDFSTYDPVGNVANGQVVPIMWVLTSLVVLVLVKGLVLGVIGGVIFTRRELAQVTV